MVTARGKFASINQKHYPDLGSERHQYGISAIVSRTSFRGGNEMTAFSSDYWKQRRYNCLLILTPNPRLSRLAAPVCLGYARSNFKRKLKYCWQSVSVHVLRRERRGWGGSGGQEVYTKRMTSRKRKQSQKRRVCMF